MSRTVRHALILAVAATGGLAVPAIAERFVTVELKGRDAAGAVAGEPLELVVRAKDPVSGASLLGAPPAVWLVPQEAGGGPEECDQWVNRLGSAAALPDGTADVNGFDVIQATEDGYLALVNPLLNLASANIRDVVDLGGVPSAWALDEQGDRLALAMPGARALRFLDLPTFTLGDSLPLPAPPTSLLAAGAQMWAGLADGSLVALDANGDAAEPIRIGTGPVFVVTTARGIVAIAASGEGATVEAGSVDHRFTVSQPVRAASFSRLSDSVHLLSEDGRLLFTVPQDDTAHPRELPLAVPAGTMAADPTGRWLALVAKDGGSVTIVDVARLRERWTISANDPVVAAEFSDSFLYFMHRRQGGATRVIFDPQGGPPGTVTIAAGSRVESDQEPGRLPLTARIPGAGIFLASARDRAAFMVSDDGAQAAMSSLPLRAGEPAGILLRYRGLRAAGGDGAYRAKVRLRQGGEYLAVVRLDQPALAHCMRLAVAGAEGETAPSRARPPGAEVVRALDTASTVAPGHQTIRFAITGAPRPTLLGAMAVGERWQSTPTEIRSAGEGYEMDAEIPAGSAFVLFVRYKDAGGEQVLSAPVRVVEGQ